MSDWEAMSQTTECSKCGGGSGQAKPCTCATKSNNEWVPEVGEVCEFRSVSRVEGLEDFATDFEKCIPEFLSSCGAVVSDENDEQCFMDFTDYNVSFRQIKTEAEKRRDEKIKEITSDSTVFYGENECGHIQPEEAEALIDAGWIKPKPLTEDVIENLCGQVRQGTSSKWLAKQFNAYIRGELDL